jgi:anti-sigma factor RsiW
MVAGTHPDDIDLFDYVEDDLPQARRADVEAHLASCSVCSEQVGRVQAGREALRGAQFMHLPVRRGEGVFMNLPLERREPGRRRSLSPKQLIAVLTPVVAVVAVIAVLANSNSNNAESTAAGQTAASAEASGGAAGGTGTRATALAPADSRAGPAADVASELRSKGFKAVVQGDRVVVTGASRREVRQALADRAPGDVQIVVKSR